MNEIKKTLVNIISEEYYIPTSLDKTKQWVKVRYEYSTISEDGVSQEVMLKAAWEDFKRKGHMYV